MDYQAPISAADLYPDPWNTPVGRPAPSNYQAPATSPPQPNVPNWRPVPPEGAWGANHTNPAPSSAPTANYGAKGFGNSYYNPNPPPPPVTSPNTIKFPEIDFSKGAAQTGMPESVLPRSGNYAKGQQAVSDAARFMQQSSPSYVAPASAGRQVFTGGMKALGVAGVASVGFGGFVDYTNGLDQGESHFRSGTNTVAAIAGGHAMGLAGAQAFGSAGAAIGSVFPGVGTVVGGGVGGFIGYGLGSIAGNASGGWLSDRILDLFGSPSSTPSPNGISGNPYSPKDIFGNPKPQIPQSIGMNPGAPPGGGGGGMPVNPGGTKSPAPFATPLFPFIPWLPDWKPPRMPWDPQAPKAPNDKKNPQPPVSGKAKPKPGTVPINPPKYPPGTVGIWRFTQNTPAPDNAHTVRGTEASQFRQIDFGGYLDIWQYAENGTDWINIYVVGKGSGHTVSILGFTPNDPSLRQKPLPGPKKTPPKREKPGIPGPRDTTTPPSQASVPGQPNSQPSPSFNPGQNPTSPGVMAPFMGGNQASFVPGLYKNPNYTPPKNDGTPPGKNSSPVTQPGTAPERTPSAREAPTLNPAPSTNPGVNQPAANTPQPWTNPFFAPAASGGATVISPEVNPGKLQTGELNPGKLNTGDQSGNTKWNPETGKYEPSFPGVTDPSQIKIPATIPAASNPVVANPKVSFQIPAQAIPTIPAIPAAAKIPAQAVSQPIINPEPIAPASSCNYKPDATITVGLASFNPLTNTITYTPTLVSATNAAGFQHLAQETANMRKEVSGIHKVLEVDLYQSPTGKIVAPKAECEVLQAVMSVSPLAAVPLIKTLPQEMKVLAAMNHMYSGHHLLGRVQLPSNPMDTKAPTVSPLTTIGMMLNMYSNTIATVGIPSTISTVDAKGQTILTPFRNATDAIETTNAHVQGLQTEMSAVMEMLFKVLQNQEMAINMIHKETYKTDLLIKDTGCRTSEIAVKRPGVMTHGIKKPGSTAIFNWDNLFKGSASYTSVPIWQGDLDKQQLGLKTNMEAQKANTSVYFPISGTGDSALPKLSKKGKKDKEWERYVKTINEGVEGSVYHGPGMPESKIEDIKAGIVKKIVTDTVTFIGEAKATV